jgi:uncharacterized protein (DUF1778 family)
MQHMPRLPKGAEKREARLTLRLTQTLRDGIGRASERDRRTVTDWILRALEDAVAASDAKAAKASK